MTFPEGLKRALSKALEFDEKKLPAPYDMGGDDTDESAVFALGAQAQLKLLSPIHDRLIALVEAVEETFAGTNDRPCKACDEGHEGCECTCWDYLSARDDERKALTALREELEKMEGK